MNIGVWNTLKIDRFTPPGAYLLDAEGNDVLLPNKYVLEEYREGVTDFLNLLDAERTELAAQDAVAAAEADVFTGAVAVYKSLGGVR